MDGAEKVARRLVIARGNGPVLLEPREEVLDQMPRLVQVPVKFAGLLVRRPPRNDHGLAPGQQRLDDPGLGVVGLVCDDGLGWGVLKQLIGPLKVMGLARREVKARGIAQRVDRGVDLGAQPAPAAPEGLFLWIPPFAPALCWWARTMVASIIAYSLSASCARAWNTRCHTPVRLQREWRVCTTRKSPKRSGRSRQGMPAR